MQTVMNIDWNNRCSERQLFWNNRG